MAEQRDGRWRWWGSCRPGTPRSTPARGATRPPSTGSSPRATTRSWPGRSRTGCFDLMFFDDRLAMPGIYGGSVAEAVRTGARPVKLDLSIVLGIVAAATRRIGTGGHLLDDLLHAVPRGPDVRHARPSLGRPGGLERGHVGQRRRGPELRPEGAPGPRQALRPGRRVPRGDDRACGTAGTTTRWCSTARRRSSPIPTRCTSSTTKGTGSPCAVRLTVPRTPQGRPVLLQAGSSGRGREFAARWAELIFTGDPGIDIARAHYKDQKEKIGERRPRPRDGQDAADGLHRRGRVQGPRRGARAALPQRPRRPHGVADPSLRADELRLLRPVARRAHHRRAHRVRLGHPRAGAEHQGAHRWRHGDAGRPGRPPGHPAAGAALRRDRSGHRRPDGGVVRQRRLRRLRHRRHALAGRLRGRRSPGGARAAASGCLPRTVTPARRCASTSAWSAPTPRRG